MTYSATFVENKTIIILTRALDLDVPSLELIKSTHDIRKLTEGLLFKILREFVTIEIGMSSYGTPFSFNTQTMRWTVATQAPYILRTMGMT